MWMRGKIPDLAWPPAQRKGKAISQITCAHGGDGYINGQDQNLVIACLGAPNQFINKIAGLVGVELKPGISLGILDDCLKRRRRGCRDTKWHPAGRRRTRHMPVRIRPGQRTHPHRGNAKGHSHLQAHNLGREVTIRHITQHARHQADGIKGGAVEVAQTFIARSAINKVKHHPGQAFSGTQTRLGD